ncbi:hypothetical protein Pyn_16966 [Prunus yedoensis var. nudiflora]|uniref:Uncharacterized protein n=1 Tax=Prunus yedoensis var. nudiflora TaxID=2094558 RepID=A0A314ZIA0_PRUYE|nr:hypothetical protein Pyn_16966 [Prunus yedoensis var. nudiflora]
MADSYLKKYLAEILSVLALTVSVEGERESFLLLKLKEKDRILEHARAEVSLNEQALKKFVKENQRLASRVQQMGDRALSLLSGPGGLDGC